MIHVPAASVVTVRANPVAVCVAVTVTPGSTAALSSVTRPLISAVACAHADVLVRARTNAETTTSRIVRITALRPVDPSLCDYGFHQSGVADDRCGRSLVPSAFVTLPSHANSLPGSGHPSTVTLSPELIESLVMPSR